MKWAPTLLVLAVLGVLLWVTYNKPSTEAPATGTSAAAPAGHGATPVAAAASRHEPAEESPAVEVVKAPAARPAAAPPAPDSIVARVKDSRGRGVAQVDVTLHGADGKALATKRTDAAGRADFENVSPGDYTLSATDPDFLYTASGATKVAAKKGATNEADLVVERGSASVSGTLVDGGGAPIAEKPVQLSAGGASFSVNSDAKGRFRVSGLAAGDWKIAPRDFPAQSRSLKLEPGAVVTVALVVPLPATLEVSIQGSQLHRAFFKGDEKALLRSKAGGSSTAPIEMKLSREQEPIGEHRHHAGESAHALFAGLAPGDYEVEVVDGAGKSMISILPAWTEALPVTLREGEKRLLPAKTAAAQRGAGVEVPTWARIFMFAAIGLLVLATPVVFPPPLVPKRPPAPAKS
jgi:hypothetical protein